MDIRMGRIAHCNTADTMQTIEFSTIKENINIKTEMQENAQPHIFA